MSEKFKICKNHKMELVSKEILLEDGRKKIDVYWYCLKCYKREEI